MPTQRLNHIRISGRSHVGGTKQRGVALIFTAFILLGLVAAVGLAIEVGRLYAAQAQLDNVAQLAAIQSARVIGACAAGEPADPQQAAEQAAQSAITNNFGTDNKISSPIVELGVQGPPNETTGLSTFQSSNKFNADSAIVTLRRPAPTLLFNLFSPAKQMTAVAGAVSRPVAGISVGSKLVDIGGLSGTNGVLSALLGGPVDIGVAGYQGLVDASVTIADLIGAKAGVATPEELLNTNLTLPGALQLLADAADATTGGANSTAADVLTTLAGIADPGRHVLLGDILNIEGLAENVVDALPINVADLLSGVAQAANTGSPISLPANIDLGGLAKVTGTINVIQPPQIAFGRAGRDGSNHPRTVARTAQVAIQLNVEVLGAISGLGGALINLPVFVKVASAKATLDDIICAGPSKPARFSPPQFEHTVVVGSRTGIATIGIGKFPDITAYNPQPPANGNNIVLINAVGIAQITTDSFSVPLGSGPDSDETTFDGPFPPQPDAEVQTKRAATDVGDALNSGLGDLITDLSRPGTLQIRLLGACIPILCQITSGLLYPVLATVVNLLRPVIDLLSSALLRPVLGLLGLDVGTADISVRSVLANQPRLFCTNRNCQQINP